LRALAQLFFSSSVYPFTVWRKGHKFERLDKTDTEPTRRRAKRNETKRNETKTGSSRYFASQTHSFGFLLSTGCDNERRKETEQRRLAIIAPSANSLACFKGGRYAFAEAQRESGKKN